MGVPVGLALYLYGQRIGFFLFLLSSSFCAASCAGRKFFHQADNGRVSPTLGPHERRAYIAAFSLLVIIKKAAKALSLLRMGEPETGVPRRTARKRPKRRLGFE